MTLERSTAHRWGWELRGLRDRKGLSLAGLGSLASYDPSYLARLERGVQFPSENAARACDRVLGAGGELVRLREAADRERRRGAPAVAAVTAPEPAGAGELPPCDRARVASVRADALHKATTSLSRRYETVVAEDLYVTGMISNKKLARAVSDQGFGIARRMLAYKTAREGGTLLVADRWYPSSKTCSSCGSVKAKLTIRDRIYACDVCGHVEGRDVNAARNLLSLAASGAERLNACGAAIRPGTAGHAVLKREPGAESVGKTGTVAVRAAAT